MKKYLIAICFLLKWHYAFSNNLNNINLTSNEFSNKIKEDGESVNITNKAYKANICIHDFSNMVESVIPTVVNISVSYNSKEDVIKSKKHKFNQLPFDLQELFDKFDSPFFDDENQNNNHYKQASGSGVIIDPSGYIVTNHHVIENADNITIKLHNGKEFTGKLIGSDIRTDLALLKIDAKSPLPFAKFGDSDIIRVGEPVVAIGNPFGLDCTVTAGIISAKSRNISLASDSVVDGYIQTDASINRGNSGGPMLNVYGEIIGVSTAIYSPGSSGNVGIGFGIPSSTAQYVIDQLKIHGKVERAFLNILIQEITPDIAEGIGLKENTGGVLVTKVSPDGTGDKAGLKMGDVILSLNNIEIKNASKLRAMIAKMIPNSEVKFLILRNNKKIELSAKLEKNKTSTSESATIEKNGIIFSDITAELISKFKIPDKIVNGVVVTNINPNTKWRGLTLGDVIVSINQKQISNSVEFEKTYNDLINSKKNGIVMHIRRGDMILLIAFSI